MLPRHLTPDRFVRVALTTLLRVPRLAECGATQGGKASFLNALLTLSQFGIEPNGRDAHLIPFRNNKLNITECQVIIDYKGLAGLVMDSGLVSSIHADVVCDNDQFEYNMGQIERHKIDFKKPRGEPYAAYTIIRFKDGGIKTEVMGKDEIYAVRDKSHGWRNHMKYGSDTPWADKQAEPEMWKKTTFRRCTKWLKLSSKLSDALDYDERQEIGAHDPLPIEVFSPPVTPEASNGAETPHDDDLPMGEADTADQPKKRRGRPPKAQEPPTEQKSPQEELADLITEQGHDFDAYIQFALGNGDIENADLGSFDEVPTEVAKRHLRAKTGLLQQLARMKEGLI